MNQYCQDILETYIQICIIDVITWHLEIFLIPKGNMLKKYIIKEVFYINNGIVIYKMHNFSFMIYKVVDIINTNVILRSSMHFLQNFKLLIIIFKCNGFVPCQPMFIHVNWVYSVYPNFLIMKQYLFKIQMALNQYIPQLHFFEQQEYPNM
jgi:hypothetical protein